MHGKFGAEANIQPLRLLVAGAPPRLPVIDLRSGHVGFVVKKVSLGQIFSKYFDFPCQFPLHRLLHINNLSSGAGTEDQIVADIPSELNLPLPHESKIKKNDTTLYSFLSTRQNITLLSVSSFLILIIYAC
jgi:hypothetical protein